MSSPPRSEPLDLDLPTTAEDSAALARVRPPAQPGLLQHLERLQLPAWLPPPRDRGRTSEGREPFEL